MYSCAHQQLHSERGGGRTRITTLLAALLCLALPGCTLPPAPWAPARLTPVLEPDPPHARIVTLNVNLHGVGRDNTIAALLATQGDIVFLQETSAAWAEQIEADHLLTSRYPHRKFMHAFGAGGQGILSRWPVREVAVVRPENELTYPQWVVHAETPFGPLIATGLHLKPPVDKAGRWQFDLAVTTPSDRRREIARAWTRTEQAAADFDAPIVVLGDFNELPTGAASTWLRTHTPMRSALEGFDHHTPTWRWRVAGVIPLGRRLDHIFVSSDLVVYGADVQTAFETGAPTPGSDHRPVWAIVGRRADDPADGVATGADGGEASRTPPGPSSVWSDRLGTREVDEPLINGSGVPRVPDDRR